MSLQSEFSLNSGILGDGPVHCSWNAESNLLAVGGAKGRLSILRTDGSVVHQFSQNRLLDLQWNPTDDTLALLCDQSSTVSLYHHPTRDVTGFDAGVKHVHLLRWSFTGNELLIGTQKGTYVIYQRHTQRRVPIVGTHSQAILDAAWSRVENRLVTMAADHLLTVSDAEGNVFSTTALGARPVSMCLLETLRPSIPSQFGHCVVVVHLGTHLHLVNLQTGASAAMPRADASSPTQSTTSVNATTNTAAAAHSRITALAACSSSSCVVGYASGRVALMGLNPSADGLLALRELTRMNVFGSAVASVAYGDGSGLIAAVENQSIRLFSRSGDGLVSLKEATLAIADDTSSASAGGGSGENLEFGAVAGVQWSRDGQKLVVYSASGQLICYTMHVVRSGTAFGSLVFYCISSKLVGIKSMRGGAVLCTVPIDLEPKMISAGMSTLAVAANNVVMYYEYYIPHTTMMPPHIAAAASAESASAAGGGGGGVLLSGQPIHGKNSNNHAGSLTHSMGGAKSSSMQSSEAQSMRVRTIQYPATVTAVRVCSHSAAVLCRGRIRVHPISKSATPSVLSGAFPVTHVQDDSNNSAARSGSAASMISPTSASRGSTEAVVESERSVVTTTTTAEDHLREDGGADASTAAAAIIELALTESLLIFATARTITVVALAQMAVVSEYTARTTIQRAFANPHGSRVAYVDSAGSLLVLNPVTNIATQAEGYEKDHDGLLWDQADSTVFVTYHDRAAVTFVCAPHSRHGPTCESILVRNSTSDSLYTPLPPDWMPLALHRGVLVGLNGASLLDTVLLQSHREISCRSAHVEAFYNNFSLNRLRWASQNITSQAEAQDLAVKALHMLDLELAIRVYRQLAQPGLVLCLEKIKHIHEKNLLIGHVSMIMGYFKDAHIFYLRSSQPVQALYMRRDLMQWEPALALAAEWAPAQVPQIATEYAQQLEYRGDYVRARERYRQGMMRARNDGDEGDDDVENDEADRTRSTTTRTPTEGGMSHNIGGSSDVNRTQTKPTADTALTMVRASHGNAEQRRMEQRARAAHNRRCAEGIARCDFRTGDLDAALAYTTRSPHRSFVLECAALCEELRAYEAAARLYEQAQQRERAVQLYLDKARNLKAAGRLLPTLSSRHLWGLYAAAKESEGAYREAADAYTQAQDYDAVVRLSVTVLNDWHAAHVLVRRTQSTDAALLVARVCEQRGEFDTAVEFLVLAHSTTRAFELAQEHRCMAAFENALLSQAAVLSQAEEARTRESGSKGSRGSGGLANGVAPVSMQREFARVADYHDAAGRVGQAAMFYHMAGNFPLAVQRYLESGEPEDIESAIRVVGTSRSDSLTNKLIDYLMGEVDHEPKDPAYIFKLYMALGSFEKAAKTCVIIATKEQEMGNYTTAHRTLVEACRILREKQLRIPNDLKRTLMLLHSYLIVKDVIRVMHDEATGCRMLLRVSRNIQKFPMHVAAIVSSTVVQCLKSGFKKSAFDLAVFLVQNEKYRLELSAKNRKRIEATVRHRGKEEEMVDPVEKATPCPFCDAPVPETELDCGACKNTLPFCVVTGKHMTRDNFTLTPCCDFPALYTALMVRLDSTLVCPMCGVTIDRNTIIRQNDVDVKALQ